MTIKRTGTRARRAVMTNAPPFGRMMDATDNSIEQYRPGTYVGVAETKVLPFYDSFG